MGTFAFPAQQAVKFRINRAFIEQLLERTPRWDKALGLLVPKVEGSSADVVIAGTGASGEKLGKGFALDILRKEKASTGLCFRCLTTLEVGRERLFEPSPG